MDESANNTHRRHSASHQGSGRQGISNPATEITPDGQTASPTIFMTFRLSKLNDTLRTSAARWMAHSITLSITAGAPGGPQSGELGGPR